MSAALSRLPAKPSRTIAAAAASPSLPAALLLACSLAWFAVRCVHGIHFLSFGDESGHFLGARAMRAGDVLYRDYIDAHGPLCFMAAQLGGWLFGWKEPLDARWVVCLAALLTGACVAASPVLRSLASRLWAAALFLGLISPPWLVQALNEVNYHVLAGLACAVVLAWLVAPAWLGAPVARWQAAGAGLAMVSMAAAAYALVPSALLLAAGAAVFLCAWPSGGRARTMAATGWGGLAGLLLLAGWMARYGDFVGYLTFHVIANQVYYAPYTGLGASAMLRSLALSADPARLVQSEAVVTCLAGLVMLGAASVPASRRRAALLLAGAVLCVAGLVLLNARGAPGFQNASFLVAGVATFALAAPAVLQRSRAVRQTAWAWAATAALAAVLAGSEATGRHAVISPFGATRQQFIRWQQSSLKVDSKSPLRLRLAAVLKPGERLLAIPYNPDVYLSAGVLPIRKFHAYLPWEADYARTPWFGRTRDLCDELQSQPPPVIVYDGWVVWNKYPPETYIPCLKQVLTRDYVADAVLHVYVRRDRVPEQGK